jgi:tricorn protease
MPSILAALIALSTFAPPSYETKPDIHGDLIVFTAEGDLWLANLQDRQAKRITSDPGVETNARFSPDGKMIAFNANYDGGTDVYVMPVDGGAPTRLTYDPTGAAVQGWTPDGKSVLFRSTRYMKYQRLWIAPVDGGQAKSVAVPQGYFGAYGPNGMLAYVPTSFEWANWFRYRAGGADDIWTYNPTDKLFKRITTDPAVDTTPVWCGDSIYFVSERSGTSNIWKVNPTTMASVQVTHYGDAAIRYPGSDGERVIYQHGPGLAVFDPQTLKATDLALNLSSDKIHERSTVVPVTGNVGGASPGPSGKRIAVEARGQILSIAAQNGDMRVVENKPGARAAYPSWSPDGKKIAYISDRSGENEIWLADAISESDPQQLTKGLAANTYSLAWSGDGKYLATGDRNGRTLIVDAISGVIKVVNQAPGTASYDSFAPSYGFSPDSKFLTYHAADDAWIQRVYVYEIATGKNSLASSPNINSHDPTFDASGKYLVYLADRSLNPSATFTHKYTFDKVTRVNMVALAKGTPSPFLVKNDEEGPELAKADDKKPTVVDEGLALRNFETPVPASRYRKVIAVGGRLLLIDSDPDGGAGSLKAFDIDKKSLTTIVDGVSDIEKTADGKKLMVASAGAYSIIEASAGPGPLPSPIRMANYNVSIEPREEWNQIFEESWRLARDFFYDPGMHGVDWNAMHAKYKPMLAQVGDRADLTRLIKDMVSELNVGHAYVNGPSPFSPRRLAMGFLGIDVEAVPGQDAVRVTKVLRGDDFQIGVRSPFAEPGVDVNPGDYILAVAGQKVSRHADFQSLLVGKTGQTVAITVNTSPSMTGARVVRVQPLNDEAALRYNDWVEGRAEYVRTHGGEKFGYAHIPDMGDNGLIGFTKGQFQNIYKEGMIYDTRYNGGGYVSSLLLENIRAKPTAWFQPRTGQAWSREDWANLGYSVAICNEGNFSDGELFIEAWKKMKIGPVVGKRTGGGEVGSGGGYRMIDGGSLYIPNYGAYVDGHWIIEGTGAAPDIDVDQDPTAVMAGKDPQLDKAIEVLKALVAKKPVTKELHPTFPKKGIGG